MIRHAAKTTANGFDRKMQQAHQRREQQDRDQRAGHATGHAGPYENNGQGHRAHGQGNAIDAAGMFGVGDDFFVKFSGRRRHRQSKEITNLGGENQDRDPAGEANRDRIRDELDDLAEFEKTHDHQQRARQHRGDGQPAVAELLNRVVDQHDEGARWTADLHTAPAERRNQETGHHRGIQPLLGLHPRGDGQRDGQRQRDNAHE